MSRHSPHARSCHENCDALFPPAPETVRAHPSRLSLSASLCSAVCAFLLLRKKTPSQRASNVRKVGQASCLSIHAPFPMSGKMFSEVRKTGGAFFQCLEQNVPGFGKSASLQGVFEHLDNEPLSCAWQLCRLSGEPLKARGWPSLGCGLSGSV